MKQILKGKFSLFTVFFLFLSLFSFAEKKSYTEVITSDPMVEKGLSVSVGKKIGIWRPPTEKKELPADRKVTLEDLVDHALTYNAELGQLRAEVNQAKIGVMGAKSNYFPKIDFSASMSWFLNPLDDIRIKQGELGIVGDGLFIFHYSFFISHLLVHPLANQSLITPLRVWYYVGNGVKIAAKLLYAPKLTALMCGADVEPCPVIGKRLAYFVAFASVQLHALRPHYGGFRVFGLFRPVVVGRGRRSQQP